MTKGEKNRKQKPKLKAKKIQKPDFLLSAFALVILAFGLVMVLSAGAKFSYQNQDNTYYLFQQQFMWALVGLVGAFVAFIVPFKKWRRICGMALLVVAVFLVLVKFPTFGSAEQDMARWINIAGIRFQPSELAKPIIVIFLAHNFDRYPVGKLRDALLPCLFTMSVIFLVLSEDLGTSIVMLATMAAMLLQTAFPLRYFIVGIPAALLLGGMYVSTQAYQMQRITGWLDPWNNVSGSGYQTALSEYALAMGGLLGIGIGSNSGTIVLPEKYNDMIFSVIGQEFGFFGAGVFLLVLVLFIIRCFYISTRCQDSFGRLLGFGLSSMIAIQCVINISASIGLMPITGVTLPLVSYGGTSLVITMFEIGILLNISRYSQVKQTDARKNSKTKISQQT